MLVIIESPYRGDRATHALYLKRAMLDSIQRGETPFASHGFFTQFFDDSRPEERTLGIELGYKFWEFARFIAFYTDYSISTGMLAAMDRAIVHKKPYIIRHIGKNDAPNTD